jgi:small RNA 2'-O-methyltransferase
MKLNNRSVNLIKKLNDFVNNYKIVLTDIDSTKGLYSISIQSDQTLICDLLQYCYFIGYTLHCLTFGYGEKPDKHGLDKIIKIMNNVKIPYYIRYLYKIYMIGKEDFLRVKEELQGTEDIKMVDGNTQTQRYDCIARNVLEFCESSKNLGKNPHIVDIGCGEGYYIKKLLKLLKTKNYMVQYHAHDIDPDEMQKIKTLKSNESDPMYSSLHDYDSLDQLTQKLSENTDNDQIMIVFTEVIEHIPVNQVEEFMNKLIQSIKFHKMLITTPDHSFNQFYSKEPGEFRDDDHKQEFTRQQFCDLIEKILKDTGHSDDFNTQYLMIGDTVQGISMSQGFLITRTK